MRSIVLVVASLSVTCACSSSNDRAQQGRGSESCRIWQDAVCDHFADECGAIDRADCDRQYQSVTCRSDAVAKSCTETLEDADCGKASSDCLIEGVADFEPAVEACQMLAEQYCELTGMCVENTDMERCVTSAETQLQCQDAVAYRLEFESCLDDIDALECTPRVSLPRVCRDVIIVQSG